MGEPLSVTFSDIFMQLKIENKVVTPLQPKFYRGYVHGVFKRCKENVKDIFFFQVSWTIHAWNFPNFLLEVTAT